MSRIVLIATRRVLAALALLGLLVAAMLFTSTSAHAASPKFGFSRTVYVGSFDHNVYALDALTGLVEWQFTTGGPVSSSPTEVGGVVYVGSQDRNLYALDAFTGTKLWQFTTGGIVFSSPTLGEPNF